MKHYVMIFRVTRTLSPELEKQRHDDIQGWVKKVTAMGVQLNPYALGPLVANYSIQDARLITTETLDDPQLSNVVFFDAPSVEEAKHIAEMHPGLHYGVKLELREWTSPRETAARQ